MVRAAVALPCHAAAGTGLNSLSEPLPRAESQANWVRYSAAGILDRRMVFGVAGDELAVQFTGPVGRPHEVTARYLAGAAKLPLLLAVADGSCTIHSARRLSYDAAGRPEWLQDLDSGLRPTGAPEPLNPPVPAGEDPPGIAVGHVDSGVNYLLPEIAPRMARDHAGQILGYDFWDLDRQPFDAEPTTDPFHPERHGTRTASLLLAEAPVAKLVPYRYPRNDMTRMTALIDDAAARGLRVINLSLVSTNRAEWLPFQEAARVHPEMLLVVAAGNHGRNLEEQPAYPASFELANMIVVTSASADGNLTAGVNWGPTAVDLMVQGEDLVALDFDGARRSVSGSSYATARVSALAACLLAGQPHLSTAELKAAILRKALPDDSHRVAAGFVPNAALGASGSCRRQLTWDKPDGDR